VDQAILDRVARGDNHAMEECFDSYGRLVRGIATRVLNQQADADDAVQEAFAAIWMMAGRFDRMRGSERGFIAMIAKQKVIDHLRRLQRSPLQRAASLDRHAAELPSRADDIGDDMAPIHAAFNRLNTDQQRVIRLALQHALTREQISRHTEYSVNTVKSHMRRGLQRLREHLGV